MRGWKAGNCSWQVAQYQGSLAWGLAGPTRWQAFFSFGGEVLQHGTARLASCAVGLIMETARFPFGNGFRSSMSGAFWIPWRGIWGHKGW
jgi:hypothetical protein